ncbi:cytochrome c oxidase subunit 8 [Oratosquilla oratoria]|uniref:cytochrome c oxidase subunit 8 n=1 Tax=Oratosquilla oratoria TaxID=337810 RepID=UPI003F76F900
MFALRKAVTNVARASNSMVIAKRTSIVSGPPQNRVSLFEKMAHGFFMSVGIMAIPAWVLVHIKDYRGREGEE